jgi:hypothetical protein
MQQILKFIARPTLILLLAHWLWPGNVFAECQVRSASSLIKEHEVGPVLNLIKTKYHGQCVVQYELEIDGLTHFVKAEAKGNDAADVLCNEAIDKGRKNILITLGGKFQKEAITICHEGKQIPVKINIGDSVLETEMSRSPVAGYFNYRGAKCRLFTERRNVNRTLKVYNGVICQTDEVGLDWLVVDKW